jgi:hypothetical protein
MNQKLLPCPFCGLPATIEHRDGAHVRSFWLVGCFVEIDGVSVIEAKLKGCGITLSALSESEAVAKWNTRHVRRKDDTMMDDLKQKILDVFDGVEFYDMAQAYRHASTVDAQQAYDALRDHIADKIVELIEG